MSRIFLLYDWYNPYSKIWTQRVQEIYVKGEEDLLADCVRDWPDFKNPIIVEEVSKKIDCPVCLTFKEALMSQREPQTTTCSECGKSFRYFCEENWKFKEIKK